VLPHAARTPHSPARASCRRRVVKMAAAAAATSGAAAVAPPFKLRRCFCDTPLGQVHVVMCGLPDTRTRGAAADAAAADTTARVEEDARPPLVLLHQMPSSTDEFAELMPLLAAAGLRLVAVDLPGYGASDAVPLGVTASVEGYADCVARVMDHLRIGTAALAGVHLGGIVAAELAAARPERVASVLFIGPIVLDAPRRAAFAPYYEHHVQCPHVCAPRRDGAHLAALWARFARHTDDAGVLQRCVRDVLRAGPTTQPLFPAQMYAQEERLPRVRCPALVLRFRDDGFSTDADADAMLAAFKHARTRRGATLEGAITAPSRRRCSPGSAARARRRGRRRRPPPRRRGRRGRAPAGGRPP
jgi:pimeloyl-ACP methyl ester carboxylesterase